jgi:hypothetical protein
VVEINLWELDAGEVVKSIKSKKTKTSNAIIAFVPLMLFGDDPGILKQCTNLLLREEDLVRRASIAAFALVFAEKAGCLDLWKDALREIHMEESKQVKEWQQAALMRGLKEGALKNALEAVQEALIVKFKSIPEDINECLQTIVELELLKTLLRKAITATSIKAFRRELATLTKPATS